MNPMKIMPIGASLLRTNPSNAIFPWRHSNARIPNNLYKYTRQRFLSSKKNKAKTSKPKLSKPGNNSGTVESVWSKSATPPKRPSLDMGKFGLKRLDYTTMKPPVWTTPPHPPTKTMAERLVFPVSILLVAGIVLWVYTSPEEEDMTEYWKRVESGRILLDDDDDDEYEDEEEDE